MAELSSGSYYCHECTKTFFSDKIEPVCAECGSVFVELLESETEELRTAGVGSDNSTAIPTSSTPLPSTTPSTSTSAAAGPTLSAPATNTSTTTGTRNTSSHRNPINITIGANPIFRGGADSPFNFFSLGPVVQERQSSPMETNEGEDPGDEVINPSHPRRRVGSQVRNDQASGPSFGVFPGGGMIMVNQTPRVSLERMIHDHIANLMAQQDAVVAEGTDQGPAEQQQQQQRQQQPATATSQASSGQPRNVQVMHFPPVQIMMSRGSPGQPGSGGGGGGGMAPNQHMPFGVPMLFGLPLGQPLGVHGSPGDYAWGPQGLDNIISRLLANLEDTGPPPTEKTKIEALPTVVVTSEDLKECTLCSVCKDDFTVGESLLKLPCNHLYHNDCVLPWLELHDTCPTCRFHLNTDKYDSDERSLI